MAKQKGVLNISTAVVRRTVIIDGKKLEMLNEDEIRLDAAVRVRRVVEASREWKQMDEDGAASLSVSLAKCVRDILPGIPKEIDEKLNDENRISIVLAFFQATESPAPVTAQRLPVMS